MGDWRDILRARSEQDEPQVYEGRITEDAPDVQTPVEVVLPAFDPDLKFGPAPWSPRMILEAGEPVMEMPQRGDRCVVALAETEDPGEPEVWIVEWWPYG